MQPVERTLGWGGKGEIKKRVFKLCGKKGRSGGKRRAPREFLKVRSEYKTRKGPETGVSPRVQGNRARRSERGRRRTD